ncbi:MAG: S41 family peptidase [Blastochloris viridis]|uniref:S41 family peptidase n=1 Tax=Blastochloris viridis TaxID=1079 RepID=A0A6N4R536_BLAVI|nr:MAG: S41 family peptidase [Blastochloris viridis]
MRIKLMMLAAAAAFTALSGTTFAQSRNVDPEVYEKLDVFAHVLEKIRTSYVEQVTETGVIENAINGMLTSLDPHSSYLKKDEMLELKQQTQGKFGGLGIEVTMDNGLVKVVSPIEDTPAAKAGLEANDYIIRIDDKDVQGMTLKTAVDNMRGDPNTKVKLVILRESEKRTFPVTLTRAEIKVKPVKSKLLENGIGYVRITSFNDYADFAMRDHIKAMETANKGPLKGLILDLRNNPGGLLTQAIAVADDFLEDGEIVSTRGRIKGQDARYPARKGDLMANKPIVVLVNSGSASAAEIVAGALQDNRRAVVVGTKSFGKGSVQTIFDLPGNTGMRLTTALYYTPSGKSIQAHGIVPDILQKPLKTKEQEKSELGDDDMPSEASLLGHLTAAKAKETVSTTEPRADLPQSIYAPVAVKTPSDTMAGLDGKPDAQLDRAVNVLRALIVWPQTSGTKASSVQPTSAR